MLRRQPISTRHYTRCPYTTLVRCHAADARTYSLGSGLAGATVSADGMVQWTAAGCGYQAFTVRVTDPAGVSSERSFTISVLAVPNAAPVLAPVPSQIVPLGQELTLTLDRKSVV